MSQQQCSSCGLSESIYGKFCSECQSCVGHDVQNKSEGSLYPKKRKKKNILSTLDILISVFIVTPLVVACWRGTWQLMDIYADYFPPWESFLIGTLIHIVIGISQESFNGMVNKNHKSWVSNTLSCLFMKLYTIVLNGVTNMHWRGGWIIVDEYFGIVHNIETKETTIGNVQGAASFFTICFLIMFAMRCLRNLNSPPFGICMDYGDDMFLFPNMFKVKLLALFIAKGTNNHVENSKAFTPARSDSILGLYSTTRMWQEYPRPFTSKFPRVVPKGFSAASASKSPLTVKESHQINLLKNPNNIQEIIDSIDSHYYKINNENSHYFDDDSSMKFKGFNQFRPVHPSEVNLLAFSRYRFVPRTWTKYAPKYDRHINTGRLTKPQQGEDRFWIF